MNLFFLYYLWATLIVYLLLLPIIVLMKIRFIDKYQYDYFSFKTTYIEKIKHVIKKESIKPKLIILSFFISILMALAWNALSN